MKHHRDIIRDTGAEAIRSMLGLESINTVRAWARRNSIPAEHWVALARAKVATLEQLAEAAAMRAVMPVRPQNPERNARIIELRKSGMWPRDIAKQMGLTRSVVIGVCFRAGLCDYQGALQQRPEGERHYKAKLTEEDVREIRRRSGESYVSLAAEFGVTSAHISHIVSGYSWAWVA